jgi:hypothetical protein
VQHAGDVALSEHTLSSDIAPIITALAATWNTSAMAHTDNATASAAGMLLLKPCEKRHFCNTQSQKSACQSIGMCYFFAPILIARQNVRVQ